VKRLCTQALQFGGMLRAAERAWIDATDNDGHGVAVARGRFVAAVARRRVRLRAANRSRARHLTSARCSGRRNGRDRRCFRGRHGAALQPAVPSAAVARGRGARKRIAAFGGQPPQESYFEGGARVEERVRIDAAGDDGRGVAVTPPFLPPRWPGGAARATTVGESAWSPREFRPLGMAPGRDGKGDAPHRILC
jgi:hypothetical protein